MNLSILLCDDHPLVVEGIKVVIDREPEWRVVAQTADGAEAVRLADALQPDIAVIDVSMPGMNGIDTAAGIRAASPRTRIVALSMYADDHYVRRMRAAGASAYVLKNEASSDLIGAIRGVLDGEAFVGPAPAASGSGATVRSVEVGAAALTDREREVLHLLAQGRRTKEIALDLGISPKTIETYRSRIMLKLDIDNLAGLVRFAIRAGIAPVE
jgi:DNA-binding NarL/FixJ family response regulator